MGMPVKYHEGDFPPRNLDLEGRIMPLSHCKGCLNFRSGNKHFQRLK